MDYNGVGNVNYKQPAHYQPQFQQQPQYHHQQQQPQYQQQPPQQPPQQLSQPPPPSNQHQYPQQFQQPQPPLPPQMQGPPVPPTLPASQPQYQQQSSYPQPPQYQQQQQFQQSPQFQQQQQGQYPQQFQPPPPGPQLNQQQFQPPYHPGPGHHGMLPQKPRSLDQHAMPSAAQLINDELQNYKQIDRLKVIAPASLPPLASTLESKKLNILMEDGGCVRPCHMRSTIYQVPVNQSLLDSSHLDFSIIVKPFDEGETEGKFYVPLSPNEIVRCNRCQAYVNPFSRNGQCCICLHTAQRMQELDERPELHLGSYEFRVTEEYYRNRLAETRRPHIIFAIEMTANSRHLVQFLSKNLASVIKSHVPTDFLYTSSLPPLVGFATYNSKITLYDVMNGGHAYVVSDMSSVTECPSTSRFLVSPTENFEEIEKFLSSLSDLCSEQLDQEQQTVLGPVIEAVLKTCLFDMSNQFQGDTKKAPNQKVVPTGKVYILHSSLPTYGDIKTPGRLGMVRNIDEMKKNLGTETESKTLKAEGTYYTELAKKCVTDYASGVELFLFPPHPRAFLNVATLGELSKITGTGIIHKYHLNSMENFLEDIKISLKSTMGFDASMRVRTSTGVSPVKYIGNFNDTGSSNLEMATVNTNSNFVVQMKYDGKIPDNDLVVIQFAMIYTSVCGERRVRVHNLALSTCQSLADLYKYACCDTLVNSLVRDAVDKMRSGSLAPKAAKEQLTTRVINILAAYRRHCTDNHQNSSSQLVLPEGLKLLPVYLCGALKCDAIDGGMEMFPDDKVLAQMNLLGALPSTSQVTVYPRMYSVEACDAEDEENEYGLQAVLKRCYYLAIEEAKGQCYILENGHYLFIFFPSTELGQNFLSSVYGPRKDEPDLNWHLREKDSNESKFLEELLDQIFAERRRALRISVVRQGRDKLEQVFRTFLYEDKKRQDHAGVTSKLDNPTYVDLLCHLHQEIRAKLTQ